MVKLLIRATMKFLTSYTYGFSTYEKILSVTAA